MYACTCQSTNRTNKKLSGFNNLWAKASNFQISMEIWKINQNLHITNQYNLCNFYLSDITLSPALQCKQISNSDLKGNFLFTQNMCFYAVVQIFKNLFKNISLTYKYGINIAIASCEDIFFFNFKIWNIFVNWGYEWWKKAVF